MAITRIAVLVTTELAAAGTAVAIQSQQGASVERQITVAVGVIAIVTFLWAVARFVLKPLIHAWYWAVIATEPHRATDAFIEALDHNDNTRAVARRFVDRLYADTLKEQQQTKDMAEANHDRLDFVEGSLKAQGEALMKEVGAAVREFTRSNESTARQNAEQTQLMREMRAELTSLREAYIRIDERIQAWDGSERRQKPR